MTDEISVKLIFVQVSDCLACCEYDCVEIVPVDFDKVDNVNFQFLVEVKYFQTQV